MVCDLGFRYSSQHPAAYHKFSLFKHLAVANMPMWRDAEAIKLVKRDLIMNNKISSSQQAWHTQRRIELDWLRVLAFALLIFYHAGMLYVADWGWHYKSTYTSAFLKNIMLWSNQWRMSLLFLISGVAVSYLLQTMHYWRFWRSRHSKILLPLAFGMTVIVVPQVYIELVSKGVVTNIGYFEFWLAYLDQNSPLFAEAKTVGDLHLTWNHLWFLMYVFSYSILLWVLYPLIMSKPCRSLWSLLGSKIPSWLLILIPILISYLAIKFLWQKYPTTHAFWGDWFNHAKSFLAFLFGFAVVRSPRLWTSIAKSRWPLLVSAIASYAYILFVSHGGRLGEGRLFSELNTMLWAANTWFWILTVIAWAQKKLTTSNSVLKYLNGGVYCFYILHQTVIILLAYCLVPIQLGPVLEPTIVILATIISCYVGYESVRRIPFVALLFGSKLKTSHSNRQLLKALPASYRDTY